MDYADYEIQALAYFNSFAPTIKRWVTTYAPTVNGWPYDVVGINETGGTIAVELKNRDPKDIKYPDVYIEEQKYNKLMKLYKQNGIVPLYICFFGQYVYVWVLPNAEIQKTYNNIEVNGPVSGKVKGNRYGLSKSSAYQWHWTNNTWTETNKPKQKKLLARHYKELCSECSEKDFINNTYKNYYVC